MKVLFKAKDGGRESTVTGYWLIEWKKVFSIVLLKFEGKSRDAYHTHAFNAFSWVIKGRLYEQFKDTYSPVLHLPSFIPFITRKDDFHKVDSSGTTWALTFRGPWDSKWLESTSAEGIYTLKSGRIRK